MKLKGPLRFKLALQSQHGVGINSHKGLWLSDLSFWTWTIQLLFPLNKKTAEKQYILHLCKHSHVRKTGEIFSPLMLWNTVIEQTMEYTTAILHYFSTTSTRKRWLQGQSPNGQPKCSNSHPHTSALAAVRFEVQVSYFWSHCFHVPCVGISEAPCITVSVLFF